MEDKRKTLRDLEARKTETMGLLDELLEKLGESLASRVEISAPALEAGSPSFFLNEKAKLEQEIEDSRESIRTIEAALRRLADLEAGIDRKEREKIERTKESVQVYADVGQNVLTDSAFEHFAAAYAQEKSDIALKIDFQQRRLEELDNPDDGFFARMANNVKSLVIKSMLAKNESALEKLYRAAGEQFLAAAENPDAGGFAGEIELSALPGESGAGELVRTALALRKSLALVKDEIALLRAERKETAEALDEKGNPGRRISELETTISRSKDEIRKVHRNMGACIRGERRGDLVPFYTDTDTILDEKILSLYGSLEDTERKIKAAKIAIAIDNERNEIAKLKKSVADKRQIIADAEAAIAGMETQIAAAEKRVDTLQDELGLIYGEDN